MQAFQFMLLLKEVTLNNRESQDESFTTLELKR